MGRGAACNVRPRATNRIPFAARKKSALRRSRSGAATAFPRVSSNGFAGNREENAVAAWAQRPVRGFRMELNPTGVKGRQFFHAKSFFMPLLRRTPTGRTADLGDRTVPPARRDPRASREL
jgi:hypothetical protein